MTGRATDRQIIARALELLKAGILASNLPERLMDEFGLTPERARELAGKAVEQQKKRGKMDTKPLDEPF